ncbi:zinc finger, CCHC-type containing protein [Tanacetum coccineum]
MKETHDLEVGYEVKKDLGLDKDIGPDTCNEYPIQLELESGLNENRKDGEKRGEHPVTSNSSGGDRLNKKRRENENDFEEINKVKVFVNGTDNVRGDEERMVSQVNLKEANDFNDFINEAKLVEIPMRGRKFTRVSDDEMKLYAQVQVQGTCMKLYDGSHKYNMTSIQSHLYPVDRVGYKTPSPIHMATIPLRLQQRDVIVVVRIGSGKTPALIQFRRISLTGFSAQSIGSSNVIALELPYLLVLSTGASQSRQHVDTSLIHIESRKSPTESLFDVGSSRISIVIVSTKEYHSDVLAESQG